MIEPNQSEANQSSPPLKRKCSLCHIEKSIEDYYWSHGVRMTRCKECHKNYVKIWRKHHREQILKHRKKYNAKYRERTRDTDSKSQADK